MQKPSIRTSAVRTSEIELRLNMIKEDRNEKYFSLEINNNSNTPYHIQRVLFFVKSKGKDPHIKLKPLHTFNIQEVIPVNAINKQMHVYKNFKLKKNQTLYVMLEEVNSNRRVVLPIEKL